MLGGQRHHTFANSYTGWIAPAPHPTGTRGRRGLPSKLWVSMTIDIVFDNSDRCLEPQTIDIGLHNIANGSPPSPALAPVPDRSRPGLLRDLPLNLAMLHSTLT